MKFKIIEPILWDKKAKPEKEVEIRLLETPSSIALLINDEAALWIEDCGSILISKTNFEKFKEMGFRIENDHILFTNIVEAGG
jgi:hypothetical protein